MLKRNWILMMMAVLFMVAGANAALDPGINLFATGDMENGGDEWIPPLNWSSVGVGPGGGVVGVSSDTRPGSTGIQSLSVDAAGVEGSYPIYSHDYADQSGYTAGTELTLSYWYKGDIYTTFGTQNAAGSPAYETVSGVGTVWDRVDEWTYSEVVIRLLVDVDGFSFFNYDNSWGDSAGQVALLDDLVLVVNGPVGGELLMGDANRDGQVSAGDYASVQANFGNTGAENDPELFGDANMDGAVSAGDYASVQANFGNVAGAAVPEPMTMTLLGLGGLALLRRRK